MLAEEKFLNCDNFSSPLFNQLQDLVKKIKNGYLIYELCHFIQAPIIFKKLFLSLAL